MAIALLPGPLDPIDIAAVMGDVPAPDLEEFVASRVGEVHGAGDRLQRALDLMATDLDGLGADDPGDDLDEALGVHTFHASAPDPDFSGELADAEAGSAELARLAGELPPDPVVHDDTRIDLEGDGFEGVQLNYDDAAPRFDRIDASLGTIAEAIGHISSGGGGGGGGGGGRTAEQQQCYDEALAAGIPQEELDAFLADNPGDECRAIQALRG